MYKIRYAGGQKNVTTSKTFPCFGFPSAGTISLPSSVVDFVPRDPLLQKSPLHQEVKK